jgi:hypothetical protein
MILRLGVLVLALSTVAAGPNCEWRPIDPGSGQFKVGAMSLDLGESDHPEAPRAWIGPITIARPNAAACTVDPVVGIVERPIFANGTTLLIATYSGSTSIVFGVDGRDCRVLWRSKPYVGHATLDGNRLTLGKTVVTLGPSCLP